MTKTKKTATRGPKLFGKIEPDEHTKTYTVWRARLEGMGTALVRDGGPSWYFNWAGGHAAGYATRRSAIRGLERAITERGELSLALGWEPKR